jgi:Rrf2 family protein
MSLNSRLASAVHIMSFLAHVGPEGSNSHGVAKSLKTNPVVVRRLLKSLQNEGLVQVRRGRNGGVALARPTGDITLGQIYRAVESDDGIFSMRESINVRCPVARGMVQVLPPIFDAAHAAVAESLDRTSLANVMKTIS